MRSAPRDNRDYHDNYRRTKIYWLRPE